MSFFTSSSIMKRLKGLFTFICLDETCRVGVVDIVDVRRPSIMDTLRWDIFCNFGATLLSPTE